MKTHDEMSATWKQDLTFRKEYDALEEEFALFDALVSARHQAGLSQAEVAERMGTQIPAVARLEAGGGCQRHSPSLTTLRKYDAAVAMNAGDPPSQTCRARMRWRSEIAHLPQKPGVIPFSDPTRSAAWLGP